MKRRKLCVGTRERDLEGLVSNQVVTDVERRLKLGEEFWRALKGALVTAMGATREGGVSVERRGPQGAVGVEEGIPRVLCLLSVQGGNVTVRAGLELVPGKERTRPGTVTSMVGRSRGKPGFPPKQ